MRRKGMVVTVGTGTGGLDMKDPLAKTVENAHPDFVVFLCSRTSSATAQGVVRKLGLALGEDFHIRTVSDENDLENCFETAICALRDLEERGVGPEAVTSDFTSGTKAMSAGLVLAAAARRSGNLCYIAGERREGKVISGTERFVTFTPNTVFAYQVRILAERFVENLMFEPAIELLEQSSIAPLPEHEQEVAHSLRELAQAYHCWERFDHRGAVRAAKKAARHAPPELGRFVWDDPTAARLAALAAEQGKAERDNRPTAATLDLLADLVCNSQRRAAEGRYDDAVARLYRATEMLAQIRLRTEFDLDANDLDTGKLPSRQLQKKYDALREWSRGGPGPVKLGLRKAYELLKDLDDKVGQDFPPCRRLQAALSTRNDSLLAHGVRPVSKEDCAMLLGEVEKLARNSLGEEFDRACVELTFPWMRRQVP